jgi:hypothetical protein
VSIGRKPHIYGLEPMLSVDLVRANYFFGRVDIPADTEEGERQAILSAARGENPELDKTLPWMLLMRGMFSYLYKQEMRDAKKRNGIYLPGEFMPRPILIKPHEWAKAFNFISTSYIQNEFFKKPEVITQQVTESGRKVALALLVTNPGKGIAKSESYVRPENRRVTVKRLRRMERHRENIAEDPEVRRYLASLRDPEVRL